MTISNMTIFLKTLKYDYMQYDYFFEKIVIFYEKNMTKKKNLWLRRALTAGLLLPRGPKHLPPDPIP